MSTTDSPATAVVSERVGTEVLPLSSVADGRMTHYRWVILGLIFCGTTLNYLDRLVIAILFLFLRNVRASLLTASVIPLALLG